jgi:hypothetical protein
MFALLLVAVILSGVGSAAERKWQEGIWRELNISRPKVVFGIQPGSSGTGMRPPPTMTEVRTYVIETDELRLELKDAVPGGRRSIDVTPGAPVTFALEKNTMYVRDADGAEHKLRVAKKTPKPRP